MSELESAVESAAIQIGVAVQTTAIPGEAIHTILREKLATVYTERDALRARVEELEEQLANTAISFSQMEEDMYQAQGELASLRASIVALAEGLEDVNESWVEYIVGELRKLGEGNSAAAQEGL